MTIKVMRRMPLRWADLPLRAKGLVVVALPVAGLLTATAFAYLVQQRTVEEQAAATHIVRVRSQIQTVLTLLLDAETGIRGFALSQDERFLEPYSEAFDRLPGALASLEELVGDNPSQLSRAQRVRFLTGSKLEGLGLLRQQASEVDEPQGLLQDNELMGELRSELTLMETAEERRLRDRLGSIDESQATQENVFVGAIFIGLTGGVLAMVLFTTGIAHRVDRIAESARRLVLGRSLPERPGGQDEVGRLAGALGEASVLLADREQSLLEAKNRAEEANWAKSDFLSRTSHELRTPLTAIRGFSAYLEKQELAPEHAELMGHIIKGSDHLTGVLNDVLDIARIEAGSLAISANPVSVKHAVRDATALLNPIAADHDVRIKNDVDGCGLSVVADEQRLRQILINLISNAIKYNRRGGLVSLTYAVEEPRLWISVTDQGVGIKPEDLPRLFVAYERIVAKESKIKGIGLGLTISKSLAELMDGELKVASVVGTGTTFSLGLPLADTPSAEPPESVVDHSGELQSEH